MSYFWCRPRGESFSSKGRESKTERGNGENECCCNFLDSLYSIKVMTECQNTWKVTKHKTVLTTWWRSHSYWEWFIRCNKTSHPDMLVFSVFLWIAHPTLTFMNHMMLIAHKNIKTFLKTASYNLIGWLHTVFSSQSWHFKTWSFLRGPLSQSNSVVIINLN